jgi:hypothetical protein
MLRRSKKCNTLDDWSSGLKNSEKAHENKSSITLYIFESSGNFIHSKKFSFRTGHKFLKGIANLA